MAFQWEKRTITRDNGQKVEAVAPVIISASRSTDVPAFHAKWFVRRLQAGYTVWLNPFNQKRQYISFADARAIVFWSKNPAPLLPLLPEIDAAGLGYYFQFTVNDYQAEGFEPRVPALERRIATFQKLSSQIGSRRVIWRYDPIMLSSDLRVPQLLERIERIGNALVPYTNKLVFSFVDVSAYRKVQQNLIRETAHYNAGSVLNAELGPGDMKALVEGLDHLRQKWIQTNPQFELATCAESQDFSQFSISHNKCIDDDLLASLYPQDKALMHFLGHEPKTSEPVQGSLFANDKSPAVKTRQRSLKDTGQRKACGCIFSKDIGAYNTCGHLCAYCYANTSTKTVLKNLKTRTLGSEGILV